jgi:hypothetical protein
LASVRRRLCRATKNVLGNGARKLFKLDYPDEKKARLKARGAAA